MWKLIKTDYQYTKTVITVLLLTLIVLSIVNIFSKGSTFLPQLWLISLGFIGAFAGSEEVKTKRIRLHSGLPIPLKTINLMRYVSFSIYWGFLLVLYFISTLVRNFFTFEWKIIQQMLIMTGGIFTIVSAMNINQDLLHCYQKKGVSYPLRIISIIIAVTGAVIYLGYFNLKGQTSLFNKLAQIQYIESFSAIAFFIIGMLSMLLSIFVFNKRISYLE